MKQKNFLKIAMLFVFALTTNYGYGQLVTTIDFETENSGYTPSATEGSSYQDVFNRFQGDVGGNTSFIFGIEDTNLSDPSIQLDQINITGSDSFTFSIDMIAHHYNDWDNNEELLITYSIDGGAYQNLLWVQNTGETYNDPAAIDTDFDGDGECGESTTLPALSTGAGNDCTVSSNQFATFVTNAINLSSNSTLDIKLQFNGFTSTDEGMYFDNIIITETASSTDPSVTFNEETSNVTETDADVVTAGIPVTLTNYSANVTITPTVNTSSTADAADYTIDLTPLTFSADETLNIPLTIHDDADFNDETLIIDFTVTAGTADLGTSQHTVSILDDELAPTISFDSATSSETETDATFNVLIPVTVANYSGTQIDVSVAASGTAESEDFTLNTTSLSFPADGSQNISLDINDDADTDGETIILTITETSAVTGLIISENTHTITVIDDETPPMPTAGTVFITEVSNDKGGDYNAEFIEIFNNSNETVSLATSKIIRLNSSNTSEYVFDFGIDESTADIDLTIPPYGFIIVARAATRAEFDTDQGSTLPASVNYNGGNTNLYFGSNSRRWKLMTGGTENTDDGTLIDDTGATTGVTRIYRNIFTATNINDNDENGTPGELEYLVYSGGAWVNGVAMDATTAAKDAYFYDDFTLTSNSSINNIGITTGKNFTINSGNSLIVDGTSTGNVTYQRNLATSNWYLVASPVNGENLTTMMSNNNFVTNSSNKVSFAPYDNAQADSNNRWAYFSDAASDALVNGKGYSTKLAAAGIISYTGTLNTEDVALALTQGNNNYNLLGNPYTSYINSGTFLTAHTTDLTQEIYVWNENLDLYETKTASSAFIVAPGQGFFVEANSTNSVTFSESNQSHQSTDTFQKESAKEEVQLFMSNGKDVRYLKVYYTDNATTSYDSGFDGKLFGGVPQPFALYSNLVSDSQGKKYQIQSLPKVDYAKNSIPVGVDALNGQELIFTAKALNLPSNLKVFLEDRDNNKFTQLDKADASYKVTLTKTLNGIGRFYLHTSQSVLSTENAETLKNISIYTTNNATLKIAGLSQGNASIKLFNVLGKQVISKSFETNGVKEISLPKLAKGLYIVQLETENGKANKKIFLE